MDSRIRVIPFLVIFSPHLLRKTGSFPCLILPASISLRIFTVTQYLEYYNHERPHSGIGGVMIHPLPQDDDGEITMFSRLGGFLKSYRRIKTAS